jgi:hypothetical protein
MSNTILAVTELSNIRKNCMGTISFDMMYKGMRKSDRFTVYPKSKNDTDTTIIVQSGDRFGRVDLSSGKCVMAVKRGFCNSIHLSMQIACKTAKAVLFSSEQCAELRTKILGTYSHHAGTNGMIYSDNSGVTALI